MGQRIFLSYASDNGPWVHNFCNRDWFGRHLPGIDFEDYQDMVNFGSVKNWIDEEINRVAGVVAFISRYYIESKYSQVEWQLARKMFGERHLSIAPVIMDNVGKSWWKERKEEFGKDFRLGGEDTYAFVDFSNPNNNGKYEVDIISQYGPVDLVTRRISELARLFFSHLNLSQMEPEPSGKDLALRGKEPEPPTAPLTLVVLGHPTSVMQRSIVPDVDALTVALSGFNVHPSRWGDEWVDQPAARGNDGATPIEPDALFVQPAAPRDAMVWGPAMPKVLDDWLKDSIPKFDKKPQQNPERRIVLWLPSEHATDDFRRLAAEKPTLRHDSPKDLATWIHNDLSMLSVSGPAVTMEAIDQGRLRHALEAGCADVVSGIVTPPPDLWSFYNQESLIKQLEIGGKRAIVALHDLNTPRALKWQDARAAIESKIKALMERIDAMEGKLDLFWTIMVVSKAKLLPFLRFPGSKLPNVALLPFNEVDPTHKYIVEPDPDALKVVQSYLQDWMNPRA
jgi:hypothetical protein